MNLTKTITQSQYVPTHAMITSRAFNSPNQSQPDFLNLQYTRSCITSLRQALSGNVYTENILFVIIVIINLQYKVSSTRDKPWNFPGVSPIMHCLQKFKLSTYTFSSYQFIINRTSRIS